MEFEAIYTQCETYLTIKQGDGMHGERILIVLTCSLVLMNNLTEGRNSSYDSNM